MLNQLEVLMKKIKKKLIKIIYRLQGKSQNNTGPLSEEDFFKTKIWPD